MPQYNEELYINDLVDEAKKWVKVMQEEDEFQMESVLCI